MTTGYSVNGLDLNNIINISSTNNTNYQLFNDFNTTNLPNYALPYQNSYASYLQTPSPQTGPSIGCVTNTTYYQNNGLDISTIYSPYMLLYDSTYLPPASINLNSQIKYLYFIIIGSGGYGGNGGGNNGGSGGGGGTAYGFFDLRNYTNLVAYITYNTNTGNTETNVLSIQSNGTQIAEITVCNGGAGSQGGGGTGGSSSGLGANGVIWAQTGRGPGLSGNDGSQSNLNPTESGYNRLTSAVNYPWSPVPNGQNYGNGGSGSGHGGTGGSGQPGMFQLWFIY